MFKKRTRPQNQTTRERSILQDDAEAEERPPNDDLAEDGDEKLPLSDLLELRKLRKSRQGIDSVRLTKGDTKKKKRKRPDDLGQMDIGGLKQGVVPTTEEEEDEEAAAKARRAVRVNNFTQQTNALDVDKHMMAYIEENLKIRGRPREEEEEKPVDPQDALYNIADKWKVHKQPPATKGEGSVTNSMTMLTAIPEVDLGMDTRLKNIEDTEKAKRIATERKREDSQSVKVSPDEEHLVASRFYRPPNHKTKSDADILRDAKLEAQGLPPQEEHRQRHDDRHHNATDEAVMERFKKRMRK